MNILLDPTIYAFNYTESNFDYLQKVVFFIDKYLNMKYFAEEKLLKIFYELNQKPFSEYKHNKEEKYFIFKKILSNMDYQNSITTKKYYDNENNLFKEKTGFDNIDKTFNCIINTIIENNLECLLFVGLVNQHQEFNNNSSIKYVKHIYKEVNSYLSQLFSDGSYIKSNCLEKPDINHPLPNNELCCEYRDIELKMLGNGNDRIVTLSTIGTEVILRNGYLYDEYLSKINTNNGQIRTVFKFKNEKFIYLSIDSENGLIEVFDHIPYHKGACDYDGNIKPNSQDPKHHILILHK